MSKCRRCLRKIEVNAKGFCKKCWNWINIPGLEKPVPPGNETGKCVICGKECSVFSAYCSDACAHMGR